MFHIFKCSRHYQGRPYAGPSSNNIPLEFDTLEEAKKNRDVVAARNPVGWDIFNSETGEKVSSWYITDPNVLPDGRT